MKIADKITLTFFAATVALIAVSSSIFYLDMRKSLMDEVADHLETTARSREKHILTYLQMLKSSVAQLSRSVVLENFLRAPADDPRKSALFDLAMERLRRTMEADPSVYEFLLMDPAGNIVASSDSLSIGQDESADSLFVGGLSGIFVKDAYYNEALKRSFLAVSSPVVDARTGRMLGVLAARVELADLFRITTERTGLRQTGEIYIINKYGYMITPSRFSKDTFLKQKVDTDNARLAALHRDEKERELVVGRDYRGHAVYGTHAYIPELQWRILTEIDAGEILAPLVRMRALCLTVLLLASLIALAVGRAVARAIAGPIYRLQEGMEKVGTGKLNHRVGTDASDEIGQLSRAFDAMIGALQTKIVSIDILKTEIAARKRVEQSLTESERKFRTIFESSKDAMMMLEPDGGFTDANKATLELFGCDSKERFASLRPVDISPARQPDGRLSTEKAREMMMIAMKQGSHFFEWTHKRLSGEEFPATVLLTRLELDGKEILQATVRNIALEIRAHEVIQSAAREWAETFDSMPEGVSIHTQDFEIMNVNASLCRMLGKGKEELLGKKCFRIFHNAGSAITGCPAEMLLITGKSERAEIFEPTLNRWLEVSVSPVRGDDGAIARIIHVVSDVTERKKAEAKVAEAMAAKSRFLSMVSHELRTPMTAIREGIGIVLDGSSGPLTEEQKDFLETAKRNVDRLSRLVNDVLDFQRLDAGRASFTMRPGNVGEVIDEVVKAMLPVTRGKELSLESRVEPGLPMTLFDRDMLTQVLINLVNNAVKFTDAGGVTVAAARKGDSIVVSVSDTGVGIKKEDIGKLFRDFSQLEEGLARRKASTGLGLAISKKIVEAHKGEIWVESEFGKGAAFKFRLPVRTKLMVMVIDDDKEILSLCRTLLEREGYEVACVENGAAGILAAKRDRPDIVILDMVMAGIRGYEVIGRLRSDGQTSGIPILAMSGYSDELEKLGDKQEDATLLSIAKPFESEEFLKKIRLLLKQKT